MSNIPKLDDRDFKKLLYEVKTLAKQYTPEWNFDENSSDFGVVFAKIFCQMMESTISRYNKTSYNHYLTFLNLLGVKLRSSSPASGMVVANAVKDSEGAYIEKGTALYADVETEEGTVIYETLDSFSVIDTAIKGIYFTDSKSNFIGCAYKSEDDDENEKIQPFRIFDNVFHENLQSHEVYFSDMTIFDMRNTDITFMFYNNLSQKAQKNLPKIFSDHKNVTWEYFNGEKWIAVDSFEEVENGVRVKFNGKTEECEVMGVSSRFIRCKFKFIPEGSVAITSVKYSSHSNAFEPDGYFSSDNDLSKKEFYPFGEQYNVYDTFEIKCDEAFTKKGSIIELTAQMQFMRIKQEMNLQEKKYKFMMTDVDFADLKPGDIEIEKVVWEYWNGSGWAKLMPDNYGEDFFKLRKEKSDNYTIKFKCPEDMETVSVGSSEGYFIRARITKIRNEFDYYANYVSPLINEVSINYDYQGVGRRAKELLVRSNMEENNIKIPDSGVTKILEKTMCDAPAMYINLEKPLSRGVIRIFVDIEQGVHQFNPALKWEYFADDHKGGAAWRHMDVMDGTDNFSHSEIITIIGKNDFKKTTIFGHTGYFIRVINPDGKYRDSSSIASRPIINNIVFNATRVIQHETKPAEYFSVEPDQEDLVCQLYDNNVLNVNVWVDELGKISTNEQERFLKMSNEFVQPEYDDVGQLERLWIKWSPVQNLVACKRDERVYELDAPNGKITFGNNQNGKIPPSQYNESIKIEYCTCQGTAGNVDAHKITDFMETVLNVESVDNPSPILGGVNMETIDNAARRIFGQVAGGNRLVSLSDFEDSICFNDRNIYKVKCLSHVDEFGKPATGVTSIAVLPREFMQGYEKFQGIKNRIWQFVNERAPVTIAGSTRLRVFEVDYVETAVSLDIVINDFNSYQHVFSEIEKRLEKFLNPVNGNFSSQGWNIGSFPRKEFIYNYIKTVPGIKWIKQINIFTKLVTDEGKKEIDFENIENHKFVVPVFAKPEINIKVN